MTELSGSVFEPVWQDGEFVLSRRMRDGERSPLLVLSPALAQPALGSLRRLEHAYGLRDELDPAWAVRPLALVHHHGRPALLLEDPGGELLIGLLGQPWAVRPFLRIALGLADALGQLHARGLIHKDLKPAHILVNTATAEVRLTGFGIASRVPRERPVPEPPEVIAGTLAYMAPEQTGRMNRSIDSRSDLYAYGVILYELLTGALPFTAAEPMEWIHCHIARHPMLPTERVPGIPAPLAAIVMKLLAKTAEERYQTAAGVAADLRRCLAEWDAHGRIDSFPLGEQDVPDRLLIPEKLYGRERESQALLAAFDQVVADGTPQLVLVSGYAGIGKSSVVHELHKALVPTRGLFASGKFDQYKRDVPYATLAQAFQTLVRQILGKREEEVAQWREAIGEALGPNGRLMVDLVPQDDVGQLLAGTLHCARRRAAPLAHLVHEKTAGNPFFATQFITALAEEGLVAFDPRAAAWTWDLERIRAKDFTDNVVDLLMGTLHRLPATTQDALKQLACLGHSANTTSLAMVHSAASEGEIHAAFWEAVRSGLVFRLDGGYTFLHDRVQEAAYALIPAGERAAVHLRIGRLLAALTPAEKREEAIFESVNQFNRGAALIMAREEGERVAQLNLIAGKRAKAATAYAAALNYLAAGGALL